MRFSTIFFAALPAIAMADGTATVTGTEPAKTTTTLTSTTHLVKTIQLSKIHTVTAPCNSTSSWSAPTSAQTVQTTPATLPTDKPNGAGALEAGNVIVAGIAGIVAAAML